jgi:hypothetical protein
MPAHHIGSYLAVVPKVRQARRRAVSDRSAGHPSDPGRYEIRVKGHLGSRWAAWFDGLTLTHDGDGTTRIHGPVVDQAALYGVLARVRDLGLPLLSVTQQEGGPHGDHRPDHPDHR